MRSGSSVFSSTHDGISCSGITETAGVLRLSRDPPLGDASVPRVPNPNAWQKIIISFMWHLGKEYQH